MGYYIHPIIKHSYICQIHSSFGQLYSGYQIFWVIDLILILAGSVFNKYLLFEYVDQVYFPSYFRQSVTKSLLATFCTKPLIHKTRSKPQLCPKYKGLKTAELANLLRTIARNITTKLFWPSWMTKQYSDLGYSKIKITTYIPLLSCKSKSRINQTTFYVPSELPNLFLSLYSAFNWSFICFRTIKSTYFVWYELQI